MQFSISGNNSWLFQKAYYREFDWKAQNNEGSEKFFKGRLSWLTSAKLTNIKAVETGDPSGLSVIHLVTVYPGLATGIGVTHESKQLGELKLGFEFDYTEGMPVIRGHSVKGALRAAFPQDHNRNVKYKREKAYQLHCWSNGLEPSLDGFYQFQADETAYQKIVAIEQEIFEGKKEGKLLSNYDQDVFFDAFISHPSKNNGTAGLYLGSDSITPHGNNLLKNPIPIPFLKVLPGVTFEFRFLLHNGLLNKVEKRKLFENILLENGIGAKTNVGYGQFSKELLPNTPPATYRPSHKRESNDRLSGSRGNNRNERDIVQERSWEDRYKRGPSSEVKIDIPLDAPVESTVRKGDIVKVIVIRSTSEDDRSVTIQLMVKEGSVITINKPEQYADYIAGQELLLQVTDIREGKIKGGVKPKKK